MVDAHIPVESIQVGLELEPSGRIFYRLDILVRGSLRHLTAVRPEKGIDLDKALGVRFTKDVFAGHVPRRLDGFLHWLLITLGVHIRV